MDTFDYLVVGSGFCGSIIARKLADEGKKVLIVDRRNNIGGNMYDEYVNGILVQRYGVHVFHTDDDSVMSYLQLFSKWNNCNLKCLAEILGKMVPVPFNYLAIDTFFGKDKEKLKQELTKQFDGYDRVSVLELINSDNELIKKYGYFLFEQDYKPYTCKQWGRKPEEIDPSILSRVKISLSYDDRFFTNKYQCMPENGFTSLFKNILNHPNITIRLGIDFNKIVNFQNDSIRINGMIIKEKVIYTGALDELFGYCYGKLPYRSLKFVYSEENVDKKLDAPFVVFPKHPTMTREVEFKSITGQSYPGKTIVMKEYPIEYDHDDENEPLYPIINEKNNELHNKYLQKIKMYKNLVVCGRLADYRYYDMDSAIIRAFNVFKELL